MYLHDAEFLADSHFWVLKPILLIVDFRRLAAGIAIPAVPGFNDLQRQFRRLDVAPTRQATVSYHGRTSIIQPNANKRRMPKQPPKETQSTLGNTGPKCLNTLTVCGALSFPKESEPLGGELMEFNGRTRIQKA